MENRVHSTTNQCLDEHGKELGALAGVDRPTEQARHQGKRRLPAPAGPKYERLTCHTAPARRTFITQALKDGTCSETVRKITGRKSLKAFGQYNTLRVLSVILRKIPPPFMVRRMATVSYFVTVKLDLLLNMAIQFRHDFGE